MAHGHAIPLKIVPTCDGVPEPEKRLNVSPTAVIAIAPATSSHCVLFRPVMTAVPPTARMSSKPSPIG